MKQELKQMKLQSGFTLIELMITVAIVGIIAAIAYPSYVQYVEKARRADGMAALVSFAGAMERHFTVNSTYVGTVSGGTASTPDPSLFPSEAPLDGGDKYYDLRVEAAATSFSISALPKNAQASDTCGTLTLQHTGARSQSGSGDCWP
ncbi:MAG: type IV pilin protein [Halopseudomonas sp.]